MNKRGFTLIEIVMVLVLLGILAAVAVPKYFDLQHKAQEQAAKAIAAEYQAQINGKFAEDVLAGSTCNTARKAALVAAKELKIADEGAGYQIGFIAETTTNDIETLTIKNKDGDKLIDAKIALPKCEASAGDAA